MQRGWKNASTTLMMAVVVSVLLPATARAEDANRSGQRSLAAAAADAATKHRVPPKAAPADVVIDIPSRSEKSSSSLVKKIFKEPRTCSVTLPPAVPSSSWPARGEAAVSLCWS